ncbi:unnamed protein product [Dovyalis caffra]|uniref:Uncharacterized protein n=1 Tax=Dovyalis caffra TaxID=77055 RepID=A0AAV1RKR9_9ROSI|nr:unnamed protein product [Dovyalis caffra]
MANKEHRFLLSTTRDGDGDVEYFKKNDMDFATRRHDMGGNAKAVSKANVIHVPPQGSRRRGRFRAHRSPLPWQEGIFNASAHEVPSGPNPISNRACPCLIGLKERHNDSKKYVGLGLLFRTRLNTIMKGKGKAQNTIVLRVKSCGPGIQSCSEGSLSFLVSVSQNSPAPILFTTLAATPSLSC